MVSHKTRPAKETSTASPQLPLATDHWAAIVLEMKLSSQQVRIVELVLRDLSTREIAVTLRIGVPTIKTQLDRISVRTRTRGRMQLAMHVLALSHQVLGNGRCQPNG